MVKDRAFTVTEGIVGYGVLPWEGKELCKERRGVNPYRFSAVLGEYQEDYRLSKSCFHNVQGQG